MSTHYREITRAIAMMTLAEQSVAGAIMGLEAARRDLGRSLRACREAKGLSLRKVAKRLRISAPFLSDCELGRRTLSEKHRTAFMKMVRPLLGLKGDVKCSALVLPKEMLEHINRIPSTTLPPSNSFPLDGRDMRIGGWHLCDKCRAVVTNGKACPECKPNP